MLKKTGLLCCAVALLGCFSLFADEKVKNKKNGKLSKVQISAGRISLLLNKRIGAFHINSISDNGKKTSLLSTTDEGTSSSFYLKINDVAYKLSGSKNIRRKVIYTDFGAAIQYLIPRKAEVNVDFVCFKSDPAGDTDMIKVISTVKNISGRTQNFSLKLILDTVLGEKNKVHFYTNDMVPVLDEQLFRDKNKINWVVSKNESDSIQIIFNGIDTTAPDFCALANYSTLNSSLWEPDMLSARSFDTVLSYNNSGIGLNWNSMSLAPQKKGSVVFYLAVGTDGYMANGQTFIDNVNARMSKKNVPEKNDNEVPVTITEIKEETSEIMEADEEVIDLAVESEYPVDFSNVVTDFEPADDSQEQQTSDENNFEIRNIKFDVESVSNEQLQPEYLQNLLNRIDSLEEGDPSLNREELLQLNAELNVILEILRSR